MRKTICILHTGGTIGMKPTPDGYAPATPGYLAEQMAAMPELRHPTMPDYRVHDYDPLIDSSDMSPEKWLDIAEDIAANYDVYDGFVVLHGTDTMAYTASALPFMLEGLGKPVILTGSQIPLCEVRNDARENLITALMIAATYNIPEVSLFFGEKLLRGCRAVKVSANSFNAFDSPNHPPLGRAGIGIEINWPLVRPKPASTTTLSVKAFSPARVVALRLFPGISADVVRKVLLPPVQGMVLETYGVGNAPAGDTALIAAIKEAVDRGVVVVNCTQCLRGRVQQGNYAAGSALARAGVVPGADMTAEAALAKMIYLFSRSGSISEIREWMGENLRGELTQM